MFTHIVLLKLKERSPEHITEVRDLLLSMVGKIETLREFEVGADVLNTGRSVDIGIIARFDDQAGYEAYAEHPVHLPVLAQMGEWLESVAVVDF